MSTDTSEKGLESLIVRAMTGRTELLVPPHAATDSSVPVAGSTGFLLGDPRHYDRSYCVDLVQLRGFIAATQPSLVEALSLETDGATRRQFLARLDKELARRGVIDVLRKGISHGAHQIELFYGTPSPGNERARELFASNRFSVTRQLAYSRAEARRALDLGVFVNGLPLFTFELKNSLTKQTVEDAVEQYRRDRDRREPLFALGRCVAHFAVDDSEVRFCTHLIDEDSWFLPFNQGYDDGAGNPPNPSGIKTAYLWERLLTPKSLTNILENYAQLIEEKDEKTGKKRPKQVFPRYHQLDVVRKLLADVAQHGTGKRYLIQHSAGSGKSNSIAWLAHQLIGVKRNGREVFDSVVVVTDRRLLDQHIHNVIRGFLQVSATVGHADHSGDLRRFIEDGKKIIISTVQKFPVILGEIAEQKGKRFAVIIDEAHSSQGGKTAGAMSEALGEPEDTVNDELERRMKARKMLSNASYFAFTATPKNKTLELFGEAQRPDAEGKIQHHPFHSYTMKQAIQEGFILDVLTSYTPVKSYYKLEKTVEGDPEFDVSRARKKLRRYVEGHEVSIRLKAEIMIDHFHEQVIAQRKIAGYARAMVVTNGIERAIQYFHAFRGYLAERKSPYQAIVAFSGEPVYKGEKVTESSLNGFPSGEISERITQDPYRFLICADKFQTGYDEPLLHTMYVDKALSGVKAVQTLSRLNRAHPHKHDVFVLDFQNETQGIVDAFADFYRTTVLSEETDPNKLHDLKHALDARQVYSPEQVDKLVALFLEGVERNRLDPILDRCVEVYLKDLDEDAQVEFKGNAKAFARTYDFLAALLPYTNREWEKLSILLNLLIPKLPAPKEEDFSKGILESIGMDSYRAEKQATVRLLLPDENAEIGPVPVSTGGRILEPEIDRLSSIINSFNEQFATNFQDGDRVIRRIREDVAPKVAADAAYQNAKANTPQTARIEHDRALDRVMLGLLKDDTEVYKQFVQNPLFKRFVTDMVFSLTSGEDSIANRRTAESGGSFADLAARLQASPDPIDQIALGLIPQLERTSRLTLVDALAEARAQNRGDSDALVAVERLAARGAANLTRYYVDRAGHPARIIDPEEVRQNLVALTKEPRKRSEWAATVEVVWATSSATAVADGVDA